MNKLPPLEHGDFLPRAEFHRRYEAMPKLKRAELIEGRVYIPQRNGLTHGQRRLHLATWLGIYDGFTPGLLAGLHATVRLDDRNELQPDALLMIDPALGGQSRITEDDFVEAAPELVAEAASTSASYDLHAKMAVYCRSGVREYIVWRVLDESIDWFTLRRGVYERRRPDRDAIFRSSVFPGLWLDASAMLREDMSGVMEVIQQGLASPEHVAYVERLRKARGG